MNASSKRFALRALDGMETVVRNDMLIRGDYITEEIVNPELAKQGAICGGRQTCAIGSLWLGAGIKLKRDRCNTLYLPGVHVSCWQFGDSSREEFLASKPGLKVAYDALNDASQAYMDAHDIALDPVYGLGPEHGAMERLFESFDGEDNPILGLDDLLGIIAEARNALKAA